MASVQRRSALSKVYVKPATAAAATGGGIQNKDEPKNVRTRLQRKRNNLKTVGNAPAQWEEHKDSITGYFYPLGHNTDNGANGSYYCFVGLWSNAVVVHIRLYNDIGGRLIPTKEGCCLDVDEFEELAKLALTGLANWKEQISKNKHSTTLPHQLGQGSNWYLLIKSCFDTRMKCVFQRLYLGEDSNGMIKIGIKLLMATNKPAEFVTTSKGALLNIQQFQHFAEQIEEISKGAKDMELYVMKDGDEEIM